MVKADDIAIGNDINNNRINKIIKNLSKIEKLKIKSQKTWCVLKL